MSTGSTIKEIRQRRGWTQRQLANKAGITAQSVVGYENDKINPTVKTFEKILNAMGYDLYAKPRKKEGRHAGR